MISDENQNILMDKIWVPLKNLDCKTTPLTLNLSVLYFDRILPHFSQSLCIKSYIMHI